MKNILLGLLVSISLLWGPPFPAYLEDGTDYSDAVTNSFTEEAALGPLKTVNMILGIVSQTKASDFVNKGPYQAMIKEDDDRGQIQSAGGGGNQNVEKLSQMTLIVTRKSETDPMIIKFWLDSPTEEGRDPQRVLGHITTYKGVSTEYPYGKFTMHFSGYGINDDGTTNFSVKDMGGFLQIDKGDVSGRASVLYINEMEEGGISPIKEELSLTIDVATGNGTAIVKSIDWGQQGIPSLKQYALSLSTDFYRVREVNVSNHAQNISEKVMDKSDKSHKVYRYGVFKESDGSKLTMNSGYSIVKVDDETGKEYHGYIGYWGIWAENDSITGGDTVYKEDDRDQTTAYTIVQAPGKLKKYTRDTLQMSKLHNTKMYLWNDTDGTQYIVTWDKNAGGGEGNYKILGTQNNETGEADNHAATGQYIFNTGGDTNTLNPIILNDWSNVWSEALQASLPVKADMNNSVIVSFHKEEVVTPTAIANLVNFGWEIINPDMTTIDNFAIQADGSGAVIGNVYHYDTATMTLIDVNRSNAPAVISIDVNVTMTHREGGASIGPLLEANATNIGNYNGMNFWDVERLEDIYYRWETGNNDWNKFTGIKLASTGVLQSFDAPIAFTYEHNTMHDINDATDVNGTYSLDYDGFSLNIPWKNVNGTWSPKINLKNATQLTYDSVDYRVKILEEQLMVNEEVGYVSGGGNPELSIPPLPASGYPSVENNETGIIHNANLVEGIGEKPLNAQVKVIKGVLID